MATLFDRLRAAVTGAPPRESDAGYEQRLLDAYSKDGHRYEEYSLAMCKLLDMFLKSGGYRYQITYRTKEPERLREKIVRKAAQGVRYAQLGDIEDLAGLRVVFYSESGKSRFISAIGDEISGPMRFEERKTRSGYEATHIIVALGPKRLQLSEYKRFAGMKCEIQVTTILRHAWAEIEHDLIYKDVRGLRQRDPEKFLALQGKLGVIMEKYIRRAGEELEVVLQEFGAQTPTPRN
jgi:ppGpp synthetase/RelA/SpoT-type nucleotidyltranferase